MDPPTKSILYVFFLFCIVGDTVISGPNDGQSDDQNDDPSNNTIDDANNDPKQDCIYRVYEVFDANIAHHQHFIHTLNGLNFKLLKNKNGNALGYLYALADSIEKCDSETVMSPYEFCKQKNMDGNLIEDELFCLEALKVLLTFQDGEEKAEAMRFMDMTGKKAFKHVFINQIFYDVEYDMVFKPDDKNTEIDRINKRLIMIKYYNHLLDVAENMSCKNIPTVDEYCATIVAKGTQGMTSH